MIKDRLTSECICKILKSLEAFETANVKFSGLEITVGRKKPAVYSGSDLFFPETSGIVEKAIPPSAPPASTAELTKQDEEELEEALLIATDPAEYERRIVEEELGNGESRLQESDD